ncbi:hypothetical protein COU37_05125 [Candidatus Micrarchaeota archaeon CG10_big_fil_rev_8_21_14_0_10_45_29]|nr:MAG: hypothetical protein COU37_05125 [Candidatus Micrarchaeota archaeon CG10_big_fil_rev_8_21_14_0_10_45_29]
MKFRNIFAVFAILAIFASLAFAQALAGSGTDAASGMATGAGKNSEAGASPKIIAGIVGADADIVAAIVDDAQACGMDANSNVCAGSCENEGEECVLHDVNGTERCECKKATNCSETTIKAGQEDILSSIGKFFSSIFNAIIGQEPQKKEILAAPATAPGGSICVNDCSAGYFCNSQCQCEELEIIVPLQCAFGEGLPAGQNTLCTDDCAAYYGPYGECDSATCTCINTSCANGGGIVNTQFMCGFDDCASLYGNSYYCNYEICGCELNQTLSEENQTEEIIFCSQGGKYNNGSCGIDDCALAFGKNYFCDQTICQCASNVSNASTELPIIQPVIPAIPPTLTTTSTPNADGKSGTIKITLEGDVPAGKLSVNLAGVSATHTIAEGQSADTFEYTCMFTGSSATYTARYTSDAGSLSSTTSGQVACVGGQIEGTKSEN